MLNVITICNLALSHIGENPNIASIDPPEGSAHAEKCALFFGVVRDEVLESHLWRFALRRTTLPRLDGDLRDGRGRYQLPTDYLRAVSLSMPDGLPVDRLSFDADAMLSGFTARAGFDIEGDVLLTHEEDFDFVYLSRMDDITRWPNTLKQAMTRLLAAYVAGAISKDQGIIRAQMQWYQQLIEQAKTIDANDAMQQKGWRDHTAPEWINAR